MGRGPCIKRIAPFELPQHLVLLRLSAGYPKLNGSSHVLLTRSPRYQCSALEILIFNFKFRFNFEYFNILISLKILNS